MCPSGPPRHDVATVNCSTEGLAHVVSHDKRMTYWIGLCPYVLVHHAMMCDGNRKLQHRRLSACSESQQANDKFDTTLSMCVLLVHHDMMCDGNRELQHRRLNVTMNEWHT